jgi:hypothetical protein
VQATLGTLANQDAKTQQGNLNKEEQSHVIETAQAHAKMPLSSMKEMLKKQV